MIPRRIQSAHSRLLLPVPHRIRIPQIQARRVSAIPIPSTMSFSVRQYAPKHQQWPYKPSDLQRHDEGVDTNFYRQPRLVAHIDDAALRRLTTYYASAVPLRGNVLDLCTSWRSWYAAAHEDAVARRELEVFGVGLNGAEMAANPLFGGVAERFKVMDLNERRGGFGGFFGNGDGGEVEMFDCVTCTVSVDYLVDAVSVLREVRKRTREGGTVHLAVSNRCFPSKAVRIWLERSTDERLGLVCDYLHFAGWKKIEIVDLCARDDDNGERITDDNGTVLAMKHRALGITHLDPLWIVRGVNTQ